MRRQVSLGSDDGEPIPEVREEEDEEDGGIVLDLSPKSAEPLEDSPETEKEKAVNEETAVVEDSPAESRPDLTQQEEQPPGDKSEATDEGTVGSGKNQEGDDHSLKSASFEADFPDNELNFPDTEFGESAWPSTLNVASISDPFSAENPDPFSAHKDPFSSQEGQLDSGFEAAFGSDPFTEGGAETSFADTVQFGETGDSQKIEGNENNDNEDKDSSPSEENTHDAVQPDTDPPGGILNSSFETSFGSDPFTQRGAENSVYGATEFVEGLDAEDSRAAEGIESDTSKDSSPADERIYNSTKPDKPVSFEEDPQGGRLDSGFDTTFGSDPFAQGGTGDPFSSAVEFGEHLETGDSQNIEGSENNSEEVSCPTEERSQGLSPPDSVKEEPIDRVDETNTFHRDGGLEVPRSVNRRASSGLSRTDSDYSLTANESESDQLGTAAPIELEDESRFWDSVISIDEVDLGPIDSLEFDSDHFNSAASIDQDPFGANPFDIEEEAAPYDDDETREEEQDGEGGVSPVTSETEQRNESVNGHVSSEVDSDNCQDVVGQTANSSLDKDPPTSTPKSEVKSKIDEEQAASSIDHVGQPKEPTRKAPPPPPGPPPTDPGMDDGFEEDS